MAQVKLVAESFKDYVVSREPLMEAEIGDLNESLSKKLTKEWAGANHEDEKVLKAFAGKIKARVQGSNGLKALKDRLMKAGADKLKAELDKAAKAEFKGNWVIMGDDFAFKPLKQQNLASATRHGSTGRGQGGA